MNETLVETYAQYLEAVNAQDFRRMRMFVASDVVFDWGGVMDDFTSRAQFFAFYKEAWSRFDEKILARVTETTEDSLTAWLETELQIKRDWLDCPIQPYRRGEVHRMSGHVHYRFRRGRIVHISQSD